MSLRCLKFDICVYSCDKECLVLVKSEHLERKDQKSNGLSRALISLLHGLPTPEKCTTVIDTTDYLMDLYLENADNLICVSIISTLLQDNRTGPYMPHEKLIIFAISAIET